MNIKLFNILIKYFELRDHLTQRSKMEIDNIINTYIDKCIIDKFINNELDNKIEQYICYYMNNKLVTQLIDRLNTVQLELQTTI